MTKLEYIRNWKRKLAEKAFVYTITIDGIVRYIGKGSSYRIERHFFTAARINRGDRFPRRQPTPFQRKLASALAANAKIEAKRIECESHEAALNYEMELIGLFPFSQLWNILPGGDGKTSEQARKEHEANPERAVATGNKLRELWANPVFRDRITQSLQLAWDRATPEQRHQRGQAISRSHDNERIRTAKRKAIQERDFSRTYRGRVFALITSKPGLTREQIADHLGPDGLAQAIFHWRHRGLVEEKGRRPQKRTPRGQSYGGKLYPRKARQ